MEQSERRRVGADELRAYGFSPDVVEEALLRAERGLFDVAPAADLVERTIGRCAQFFPDAVEPTPEGTAELVFRLVSEILETARATEQTPRPPMGPAGARVKDLVYEYAESLAFALTENERPLVILENHNVISPSWWEDDLGFRAVLDVCRRVNEIVTSHGKPPAARLVVLRPSLSDYDKRDFEVIRRLLREATSDVWWIPMSRVGEYAHEDVAVVGGERVLKVRGDVSSPIEALGRIEDIRDARIARRMRAEIETWTADAIPIKVGGKLEPAIAETLEEPGGMEVVLDRAIRGSTRITFKLFVSGLSYSTTSEELREVFAQCGKVVSATVTTDSFSGRSRGFGFVEMATAEEAQKAISKLKGQKLGGRRMTIEPSSPSASRMGRRTGVGETLVEKLVAENEEFRRLRHEHESYERELETLKGTSPLSAEQQWRIGELKKMKLMAKDRMEAIIRHARAIDEPMTRER